MLIMSKIRSGTGCSRKSNMFKLSQCYIFCWDGSLGPSEVNKTLYENMNTNTGRRFKDGDFKQDYNCDSYSTDETLLISSIKQKATRRFVAIIQDFLSHNPGCGAAFACQFFQKNLSEKN